MEKAYDEALDDSFAAVEKTNFYDACYSPVILIMNAAVVALVMLLSAAGSPEVRAFFGMSVGTAVAVIAYISQVFTPLESIGMEIETIQSAVAGVRRINGFLAQAERVPTAETAPQAVPGAPSVELQNVHFGYESDEEVLHGLSFAVQKGEQVTLAGRTGAGKSTIFKLLLGLYRPQQGKVMLNGVEAATLPDTARRPLVGYVEQSFRRVPGTVRDQITLFDAAITPQQAEDAARTVGLHDAIAALPEGYDTPCTPGIFSQGQWQLLSIARAIAAGQSPPLVNIPILFICFSSCFRLFVPSVHGLWVRIRTAVFLYRILPSSTPFCNCVSQHQRAAAPNSARKMPAPLRLIRVSAGSLCPDKYRNPPEGAQ